MLVVPLGLAGKPDLRYQALVQHQGLFFHGLHVPDRHDSESDSDYDQSAETHGHFRSKLHVPHFLPPLW